MPPCGTLCPKEHGLNADYPNLTPGGVSIAHGEKRSASLPSIIDGNHPLGLRHHVAVAL